MSNNILLAEIETELEKTRNLIGSGELDDVRRARIAAHVEELEELYKRLKYETADSSEIGERFRNLKDSLKSI